MFSGSVSRRGSLLGFLAGAAAFPFATPSRECPRLQLRTRGPDRRRPCRLPNRPPFDEKHDRFFHHNNLDFREARAYTFADLLALPQQSVPVVEESGEIVFKGPHLHDVLAAAKPLARS